MNWKKPEEVTEPGNYLFGCLTVSKTYYKIEIVHSANHNELVMKVFSGETPRKFWVEDFRFFGPIPEME